jgi:ribosomal protein S27AE
MEQFNRQRTITMPVELTQNVQPMPSRWIDMGSGLRVNIFCPQCGESRVALPKDIGGNGICSQCHIVLTVTRPLSDEIHDLSYIVKDKLAALLRQDPPTPYVPLEIPKGPTTNCLFCLASKSIFADACPSCGRTPSGKIGRLG